MLLPKALTVAFHVQSFNAKAWNLLTKVPVRLTDDY